MQKQELIITKKMLDRVVQDAKQVYIDRSNSDGTRYLTAEEMVARAYVEAFQGVINSMGYQIVQVSKK